MNAIKDLKLDDIIDDLRSQAAKRLDDLRSEGRKQARNAGGGHDDAALFSAFTVGIIAGTVVGAAIALLMTPLSGEQARAKLGERVDKIRSDGTSGWEGGAGTNGTATGAYEPAYTAPKPLA